MKKKSLIWLIISILIVAAIISILLINRKTADSPSQIQNTVTASKGTTENTSINQNSAEGKEAIEDISNGAKEENTPELIVIGQKREEVRTVSPVEYLEPEEVPSFYHKLSIYGISDPLYAFTDSNGSIQLRAYGSCWELINNVKQAEHVGFWDAEIQNTGNGIRVVVKTSATPIIDKETGAAALKLAESSTLDIPSCYRATSLPGVYTAYTNNSEQIYRAVSNLNGEARLYPSDSNGNIPLGSLSVYCSEEATTLLNDVPANVANETEAAYPVLIGETIASVNK